MARLFGLIGNRPDLAASVLRLEAEALRARRRTSSLGWGLGFYQGDEVLMRRRPLDEHEVVDLAHQASDVHADVLIGHVRSATIGGLRTENTHPFRYHQWLFAQTGTLKGFDALHERLLSNVPDFLLGNIRGDTDAEDRLPRLPLVHARHRAARRACGLAGLWSARPCARAWGSWTPWPPRSSPSRDASTSS